MSRRNDEYTSEDTANIDLALIIDSLNGENHVQNVKRHHCIFKGGFSGTSQRNPILTLVLGIN